MSQRHLEIGFYYKQQTYEIQGYIINNNTKRGVWKYNNTYRWMKSCVMLLTINNRYLVDPITPTNIQTVEGLVKKKSLKHKNPKCVKSYTQ